MPRQTAETPQSSKSGIQTAADGGSYIPSSKRADGTTRKEIRVRPGYRPPEDVETYKNRSAEAWKNRGKGGVPGVEAVTTASEDSLTKSKNAKRREAARRKAAEGTTDAAEDQVASAMQKTSISAPDQRTADWHDPAALATNESQPPVADTDQQKKIRNQLKKVRAIRDLREKRAAGEKLSPDQIMKIGKEAELLRDLKKLGYDGPELQATSADHDEEESPSVNG
jgi:partner of Y14 and mago